MMRLKCNDCFFLLCSSVVHSSLPMLPGHFCDVACPSDNVFTIVSVPRLIMLHATETSQPCHTG